MLESRRHLRVQSADPREAAAQHDHIGVEDVYDPGEGRCETVLVARYRCPRRLLTGLGAPSDLEDLIAEEDVVVTLSHAGYVKSQALSEYRAQKRGGRGKTATRMKEEDFVDKLFIANTNEHQIVALDLQSRMTEVLNVRE